MRIALAILAMLLMAHAAHAAPRGPSITGSTDIVEQVRSTTVRGHVTRSGTYVPRHSRTTPDRSRMNNWSSRGNANPTNGRRGTVNPFR